MNVVYVVFVANNVNNNVANNVSQDSKNYSIKHTHDILTKYNENIGRDNITIEILETKIGRVCPVQKIHQALLAALSNSQADVLFLIKTDK